MDFEGSNFDFPQINIDTSHIEEVANAMEAVNQDRREKEERTIAALEATAHNTAETTDRLNKVIENQNDYIEILKQQVKTQEQQLEILKSIFATDTNVLEAEKELMEIIYKTVDDKHPIWDYIKDKGSDVVIASIPILYPAVKIWLASKGINLP